MKVLKWRHSPLHFISYLLEKFAVIPISSHVLRTQLCSPQIHMLESQPKYLRIQPDLEIVFKEVIKLIRGHWGGALIQYDWCPCEKRKRQQGKDQVKRQQGGGHLQAKERGHRGK